LLLKTAAFLEVAPCSIVKVDHVSEVLPASIIREIMMEAGCTSETWSNSTRLQSVIFFILAAVGT
jgi:hypothetical protein